MASSHHVYIWRTHNSHKDVWQCTLENVGCPLFPSVQCCLYVAAVLLLSSSQVITVCLGFSLYCVRQPGCWLSQVRYICVQPWHENNKNTDNIILYLYVNINLPRASGVYDSYSFWGDIHSIWGTPGGHHSLIAKYFRRRIANDNICVLCYRAHTASERSIFLKPKWKCQ